MLKSTQQQVRPALLSIIEDLNHKMEEQERIYFKTHKKLATECVNPDMEEIRQVFQYYFQFVK